MKSRFGWKPAGMIYPVSALWLAILSPAAHPATLYVTNQGDNTISVINTASRKVVKTVRVNRGPAAQRGHQQGRRHTIRRQRGDRNGQRLRYENDG